MNSPYRISLKTQWKVQGNIDLLEPNGMEFVAVRSFHRPTGLTNNQVLRFCFEPPQGAIQFWINGLSQPLTIVEGLVIVPITSMMEPVNRVELRWRVQALETPQLPEHFAAWLEILDDDCLDQ